MINKNLVILQGNVGNEPTFAVSKNDLEVANFSLATTEHWKDEAGEKQSRTTWHNVTAWGKKAKFIKDYLKKGMNVEVEGELSYNELSEEQIKLDEKLKYVKNAVIRLKNIQIATPKKED